jgi:ComF family protein
MNYVLVVLVKNINIAMASSIKHFLTQIRNLIFPPRCLICYCLVDYGNGLCASCWLKVSFISKPYCAICSLPFDFDLGEDAICGACTSQRPLYDKALSVLAYDQNSKSLLQGLKYQDKTHLAPYLAKLLYGISHDMLKDADILVPVPLNKIRLLHRLYNQSSLLCLYLSKLSKLAFEPNMLIRAKNDVSQTGLSKKKRLKNVKGAFVANTKYHIQGKNIILVDDVITTGATIEACTKELLKAGAAKVSVLSVARAFARGEEKGEWE